MSIIREAHDDIIDRLGFGLPSETQDAIYLWLRRVYAFGALDERKRQEQKNEEILELKKQVANQLRQINSYRRILGTHGLL